MQTMPLRSSLHGSSDIKKLEILPEAHRAVAEGRIFAPPVPVPLTPGQLDDLLNQFRQKRHEDSAQLMKKCKAGKTIDENLTAILKAASISTGQTRFNGADVQAGIQHKFSAMRAAGQITLASITGGCKVANPLKTGQGLTPDLADWMALNTLQSVADAMMEIAGVQVTFVQLADGPLHTADASLDSHQAELFLQMLRDDAEKLLGIKNVRVASPSPHLDYDYYRAKPAEVKRVRLLAKSNPEIAQQIVAQADSLVSSLNLHARGWTYGHTIRVFGALAGLQAEGEASADAEVLHRSAIEVAIGYSAVNEVLRNVGLVARCVKAVTGSDLFLRTSVHAKPGEARLALAPSNSLCRPYLLPMHSTGRLDIGSDGQLRYGAIFDLEGRFHGYELIGFHDSANNFIRPLFYRSVEM
jgi:hypothetical protein